MTFDKVELPGEATEDPALWITPDVTDDGIGAAREVRYTGYFELVHTPTGHHLRADHWMPLVWLRRFARLLATCGIDWGRVTGNPGLVGHPQNLVIRAIGNHVLDCWRRGMPADPGTAVSLHTDRDGDTRMYCGNLHCEDRFDNAPAQLLGMGEDGRDEAVVDGDELDELFAAARGAGWRHLGPGLWLCDVCANTHQPAPPCIARQLSQ